MISLLRADLPMAEIVTRIGGLRLYPADWEQQVSHTSHISRRYHIHP